MANDTPERSIKKIPQELLSRASRACQFKRINEAADTKAEDGASEEETAKEEEK